jgi:hypothetical protein
MRLHHSAAQADAISRVSQKLLSNIRRRRRKHLPKIKCVGYLLLDKIYVRPWYRKGYAAISMVANRPSFGPRCKGLHILDSHNHNSLRPSMDFSIVISSAYSMSLPTGMPIAIRVTLSPARRNFPER